MFSDPGWLRFVKLASNEMVCPLRHGWIRLQTKPGREAGRGQASIGTGASQAKPADGIPNVHASNLASIQSALERVGIEFTNGDAPGVRNHDRAR